MVPLWTNFDIHLEWLINLLYDRQLQFPIPNRSLLGRKATSSVYEFSKEEAGISDSEKSETFCNCCNQLMPDAAAARVMSTFQKD